MSPGPDRSAAAPDRESAKGHCCVCGTPSSGAGLRRLAVGQAALAALERSRCRSRGSRRCAERSANGADLVGIIAGKLLVCALLSRTERAFGRHQGKLVPPQKGIEVHIQAPIAVSGSPRVSQPRAPTHAMPAMFTIWGRGDRITSAVSGRRSPPRLPMDCGERKLCRRAAARGPHHALPPS